MFRRRYRKRRGRRNRLQLGVSGLRAGPGRKRLRGERKHHHRPIEKIAFPPETEAGIADTRFGGFDLQKHSPWLRELRSQSSVLSRHRGAAYRSRAVERG